MEHEPRGRITSRSPAEQDIPGTGHHVGTRGPGNQAMLGQLGLTKTALSWVDTASGADIAQWMALKDEEVAMQPAILPYQQDMESLFDEDFSTVVVGMGAGPDLAANGARASAQGEAVRFDSATPDRRQVAHELAHVVQSRQKAATTGASLAAVSTPRDASERDARRAADAVVAGREPIVAAAPSAELHRDEVSHALPASDASLEQKPATDTLGDLDSALGAQETTPLVHDDEVIAAVDRAIDSLVDVMGVMFDQRSEAYRWLEKDAVAVPIGSLGADILTAAATSAFGAATGAIGGLIAGAVIASLADGASELVEDMLGDVVDDALNGSVGSAMATLAAELGAEPDGPVAALYARAHVIALSTAMATIGPALKVGPRRDQILRLADPLGFLDQMTLAINSNITQIAYQQYVTAMAAWLDLVARSELGTTTDGATDLKKVDGGSFFWDPTHGVIRVNVKAQDGDIVVTEALLAGLNEESVSKLKTAAGDSPVGVLGISLECRVETYIWADEELAVAAGAAKFGRKPDGSFQWIVSDEGCRLWFIRYHQGDLTKRYTWDHNKQLVEDHPEQALMGMDSLMQEFVATQSLAQLGVQHG